MLVYKVFVRELKNPSHSAIAQAAETSRVDNSDPTWAYEVHACAPERYLIGRGTADSKPDAVEDAMKLLDHSERHAWQVLANEPLHLIHR